MEKDIIGKPLSFLFCPPFSCIGPNMQVAVLFLRQPNCSYLYDLTFAYVVRNSIATQAAQRTRMWRLYGRYFPSQILTKFLRICIFLIHFHSICWTHQILRLNKEGHLSFQIIDHMAIQSNASEKSKLVMLLRSLSLLHFLLTQVCICASASLFPVCVCWFCKAVEPIFVTLTSGTT